MKKGLLLACVLGGMALTLGCGKEGPMGPAGPTGATGAPGITMIQEYSGSFATAGDFAVSVPEITGKRSSTFVEVYWAIPSAPDIWTPMSDGWKDDPTLSRTATVSWTNGEVGFWGMKAGDLYLIQVYQHN
jgi:hypothetical protein